MDRAAAADSEYSPSSVLEISLHDTWSGVWEVNKNISSMEITGENTTATPWMEHGQHTQPSPQNTVRGTKHRVEWSGDTAARFCQNPCTGGNLVVLSS